MRTPTARAHGIEELEILVDAHEQYAYRFRAQQASTLRRALLCGDYGLVVDGLLVASVERESLVDLFASLTSGKLRYQVADLAALPRAAVVVEDRYSQLFKLDRVRPALVADGLAELQIRWPNVPVVFCETRQLAEEWTYRLLAAAHLWAIPENAALQRISPTRIDVTALHQAAAASAPSTAEVRAWERAAGRRSRPRPPPPRHLAGIAQRQRRELTGRVHPGTTLAIRSENKPGHTERGVHQTRDTPPHASYLKLCPIYLCPRCAHCASRALSPGHRNPGRVSSEERRPSQPSRPASRHRKGRKIADVKRSPRWLGGPRIACIGLYPLQGKGTLQ